MKKLLIRWLERQRKKQDEACDDACLDAYIEIWRNTLRPGDKVWVFVQNTGKIMIGKIYAVMQDHCGVDAGGQCLSFLPYGEVFPTRESLCAHYKKIFEF